MNLDMWYVFFDPTLHLESEHAFWFTILFLVLEIELNFAVFFFFFGVMNSRRWSSVMADCFILYTLDNHLLKDVSLLINRMNPHFSG